ncbi:MAG: hypothetical protein ABR577_06095 [Pyrinomonadaceae bacterium]
MNCQSFQNQIEEFQGAPNLSVEAAAHFAACARCARVRVEHLALNQLFATLEPVVAPENFDSKLAVRLAATEKNERSSFFSKLNFSPGSSSMAFASIFVIAVCATILIKELPFSHAPNIATETSVAKNSVILPAQVPNRNNAPDFNHVFDNRHPASDTSIARVAAAASIPLRAGKHKVSASEANKQEPRIEAATAAVLRAPEAHLNTMNFSSSAAAIVARANPGASLESNAVFALPSAPAPESVNLLLKDKCGATHIVALPRVTFGARDAIESANTGCRASQPAQSF